MHSGLLSLLLGFRDFYFTSCGNKNKKMKTKKKILCPFLPSHKKVTHCKPSLPVLPFLTFSLSFYILSCFFPLCSQTKKGKEREHTRTNTHRHTHLLAAFSLSLTCTASEPNPPACLLWFFFTPSLSKHPPPPPQPALASFSFVYHPSLSLSLPLPTSVCQTDGIREQKEPLRSHCTLISLLY